MLATPNPKEKTPRRQRPKSQHANSQTQTTQSPSDAMNSTPAPTSRRKKNRSARPRASESNGTPGPQQTSSRPPKPAELSVSSGNDDTTSSSQQPKRGRKKINKSQANGVVAPASAPQPNRSPCPAFQSMSMTPVKQFYASPNFSNSPAPSSLPIPKFLSKSMSSLDKQTTPEITAHGGSEESSNSASDNSPTPGGANLAIPVQKMEEEVVEVRKPSPLDIFFNADREEKERRRKGAAEGMTAPDSRAQSASPAMESANHSRHPTGEGLFPFELSTSDPPHLSNNQRTESSPSVLSRQNLDPESAKAQAQAKTENLKRFLQSQNKGTFSLPLKASSGETTPTKPLRPSPGRTVSGSSTPTYSTPSFSNGSPGSSVRTGSPSFYNSPYASLSFNSIPKHNSQQRPFSSQLRQEVVVPESPFKANATDDDEHSPPTPTPARRPGNQHQRPTLPKQEPKASPMDFSTVQILQRPKSQVDASLQRRKFLAEDALRTSLGPKPKSSSREAMSSAELLDEEFNRLMSLRSGSASTARS